MKLQLAFNLPLWRAVPRQLRCAEFVDDTEGRAAGRRVAGLVGRAPTTTTTPPRPAGRRTIPRQRPASARSCRACCPCGRSRSSATAARSAMVTARHHPPASCKGPGGPPEPAGPWTGAIAHRDARCSGGRAVARLSPALTSPPWLPIGEQRRRCNVADQRDDRTRR